MAKKVDSEDSSSGTDDEQQPPLSKPEPVVNKPQESEESESDDESEESESDESEESESEPIVLKSPEPKIPTWKSTKAKRPADSEEPVSKNQVKGGTRKRHAEVEKVEESKKSKVLNGEGQSVGKVQKGSKNGQVEEKKSLVKWSEEDEVALLDGIIAYKVDTGEDVKSNVATFYEYVKDSFSVKLTKTQLYEKFRRLKKKFETNLDKWKNGEELVFSRPHDSELFELSKKIWGSEGTTVTSEDKNDGNVVGNTSTPVEPVTSREHFVQEEIRVTVMEDEEQVTQDIWSLYPRLSASIKSQAADNLSLREEDLDEYVKRIISRMGLEKARELEDGWKAVHVMDHQLYARRAHLISEQAQVVSDLFNQS